MLGRARFFALALFVSPALAQPPADPVAQAARQHFAAGVKLYDKGDYEGALTEFRAAYTAQSSPTILVNIAVCLRKLDRNAEAIEILEAILADPNVDPQTRASTQKTLGELRAKAATIRVQIVLNVPPGGRAPEPILSVDHAVVRPEKMLQPIWIDPGTHTIGAHAAGFVDAASDVTVKAGDRDVPVLLSLVPAAVQSATIRIKTNVPSSDVKIDGITIAHGSWQGMLATGTHKVEADATGWNPVEQEIDVEAGADQDVTLELKPLSSLGRPPISVDDERKWYLGGAAGFFGGELPIRPDLGGGQAVVAATFVLRLGRRFGRYFSVEVDAEAMGGGTREYPTGNGTTRSYAFSHIALGAGARIVTSVNSPRFTAAAVGGVVNQKVTQNNHPTGEPTITGAPTGFLQIESGAQFDFSKSIALETVAFIGLLGLSSSDLVSTVMTRAGLKLAVQFSF